MPPGETEIDVRALPDGRPARADMVVVLRAHEGAIRVTARDTLTGQFVRLLVRRTPGAWSMSGVPDDAAVVPFALAPDGSRLLVGDPHVGGDQLVSLVLATGAAVPLTEGVDVALAAFAPDGNRVAALTQDDDGAVVTVLDLDLDGGRRRELWSAEGIAGDPVIAWSPDGRFLAVRYLDPDEQPRTVVVDGAGTVVADLPETGIIGTSRRAWRGEHDLLLVRAFWGPLEAPPPIILLDPATGNRREVRRPEHGGLLGALDGRLLRPADNGRLVESTAFDGSDPRLVVDAGPGQAVSFFDAIPGALGAAG